MPRNKRWIFVFPMILLGLFNAKLPQAQAQDVFEYLLIIGGVTTVSLQTLLKTTENPEVWTNNGNRTAVQSLSHNSLRTLNDLTTAVATDRANLKEGRVFGDLVSLNSLAASLTRKAGNSGPADAQAAAMAYEFLIKHLSVAAVAAMPGIGDKVNETIENLPDEINCANKVDDDGDGATDCADSECKIFSFCVPPANESSCSNGIDDDEDGAKDCQDSDCANDPACAPVRENCENGVDDDGDTLVDCCDTLDCPTDTCQRICVEEPR